MDERTCVVPGCDNPPRSSGAEWCKKHYHRWYRHGSVDKVAAGVHTQAHVGAYVMTTRTGHPLARAGGRVYVHRMVLFDTIGPGVHPCHWCTRPVTWDQGKGEPDQLHLDHLNANRSDNRPENLAPSCRDCNPARGQQARHRALVQAGYWSSHDTVAALKDGRTTPVHERRPAA
jgi:hypothetical protein